MRNDYTAGVICAKVARYAERIHHPDRLMKPLRRIGPKGSRQFAEISWGDALDIVAEQFIAKARQHGSETVWPYYYAGTMGLVQRDGINRLRHVMKYSRCFSTICVTLSDTGWIAGVGAKRGADVREIAEHSDLVVIWGGNPVHTQVNVMTHAMKAQEARRQARRGRSLPHRHGRAGRRASRGAARHRRRARLRRHARPVQGGLCRPRLPAQIHRRAGRAGRARRDAHAGMGVEDHRPAGRARSSTSRGCTARPRRAFIRCHHGFSRSRNGAANMHAVTCLPAVTGAWQDKGGGALYGHTGMYPISKTLIEGLDMLDLSIRELDQSRIGPILAGDAAALKTARR